jgi:hypothetical protein
LEVKEVAMVPIDNEYITGLLEIGEALNASALQHDIDMLDFKMEPEFGYIHINGSKINEAGTKTIEVFHVTKWGNLGVTDIKIAPRGAVADVPTGAK